VKNRNAAFGQHETSYVVCVSTGIHFADFNAGNGKIIVSVNLANRVIKKI
jgi:hypothetical protein